jgi:branched-chain amino acid transport system substrate-binding protein
VKRAAVLIDVKNDYSVGLAHFFKQTFQKEGGKIIAEQSYSAGDVDFKSQLTSLKTQKPEVIFVPGYYTEVGLIARQAKELGLQAPLLGGDGWDSEKLTEIGGKSLDGSYFSNHYSPDDKSEHVQKFIAQYKAEYGSIPDGLAAMGYDAAMFLADAMKRSVAKSKSDGFKPENIKMSLAETKKFQGVTGLISMDAKRDAVKSAVVIEIKEGKFIFKETIDPS